MVDVLPPNPAAPPAGDPPAPPPASPPAEVKYDLKLSADSKLDPAIIERTTAIARKSGLSPEIAAEIFGFTTQEVEKYGQTAVASAVQSELESRAPGGKAWLAQQEEWQAAALADKELGGGKPETLAANVASAKQALAKVAGADAPVVEKFLNDSGLASSPVVLKLFLRIANAMKEDSTVFGEPRKDGEPTSTAEKWYGEKKEE